MLGNNHWKPDDDGAYYIDRDPIFFTRILNYLRVGKWNLSGLTKEDIENLKGELDFYQIPFDKKSGVRLFDFVVPKWVPIENIVITDDGVTSTTNLAGWTPALAVFEKSDSDEVRWKYQVLRVGSGNLGMIGAVPSGMPKPSIGVHFSSQGGGIYQPVGSCEYSKWPFVFYKKKPLTEGSKMLCVWKKKENKLFMYVDGDLVVEYYEVVGDIQPCIFYYGNQSSIKFIEDENDETADLGIGGLFE